mmetsp:Transcript_4678/g.13183  ORF Transcript_4678/g.13183 Transcript_4678/m.13183 type:complete len:89 (+) Transcript_4678:1449-1715(+)
MQSLDVLKPQYMNAFDTHGASITLLKLSDAPEDVTRFLDIEMSALSWTACDVWDVSCSSRQSLTQLSEVRSEPPSPGCRRPRGDGPSL